MAESVTVSPNLVVFWQNTRNICITHLILKYSLCILTFQIRISFAYQLSRSILNLLFYFADLTAFKNQWPLSFSRYHLVLSKLFEGNIIFNNIQTFWTWPVIKGDLWVFESSKPPPLFNVLFLTQWKSAESYFHFTQKLCVYPSSSLNRLLMYSR